MDNPNEILSELVAVHRDGSRTTEALVREDQVWERAEAYVDSLPSSDVPSAEASRGGGVE